MSSETVELIISIIGRNVIIRVSVLLIIFLFLYFCISIFESVAYLIDDFSKSIWKKVKNNVKKSSTKDSE